MSDRSHDSERFDDARSADRPDISGLLEAYALDELDDTERATVDAALAVDPALVQELAEIRDVIAAARTPLPALSSEYEARRATMLRELFEAAPTQPAVARDRGERRPDTGRRRVVAPAGRIAVLSTFRDRFKRSARFRFLVLVAAAQAGFLLYLTFGVLPAKRPGGLTPKAWPKHAEAEKPSPLVGESDEEAGVDEGLPTPDRIPPSPLVVKPEEEGGLEEPGLDDIGIGHGFQTRNVKVARLDPKKRSAALARWGGTAETEAAVSRGLAFLRSRQRDDGSFGGVAGNAKEETASVRQSALTLLAFLGRTLDEADRKTVRRGVGFLLARQTKDGWIAERGQTNPNDADEDAVLTHALAAQCLVEARAMVPGAVPDPAAVARSLAWLTPARLDGPRAVTQAGITMLVAGNMNMGFDVPRASATHCRMWFTRDANRRRYERSANASDRTFFAAGRVLFGGGRTPSKVARSLLDARPTGERRASGDLVAWLYAAQALRLGGEARWWLRWNDAMVAALLPGQSASGSFAAGSDELSNTALSVLMLETYDPVRDVLNAPNPSLDPRLLSTA